MTNESIHNTHRINTYRPYWLILKFRIDPITHSLYFFGSGQLPNGRPDPFPFPVAVHDELAEARAALEADARVHAAEGKS